MVNVKINKKVYTKNILSIYLFAMILAGEALI